MILDGLWKMTQEKHKAGLLVNVKAQELWVYLKRLYEPDFTDRYWKFEAQDLSTTWTYYDTCEVHQVATTDGVDVFMFAEKEYPLKGGPLGIMISSGLRVYAASEKADELIQRIQDQCARARRK